jgi:hypothetical protein
MLNYFSYINMIYRATGQIRLLKNLICVISPRWIFVMSLLNIFLYLSILFKRVILLSYINTLYL